MPIDEGRISQPRGAYQRMDALDFVTEPTHRKLSGYRALVYQNLEEKKKKPSVQKTEKKCVIPLMPEEIFIFFVHNS